MKKSVKRALVIIVVIVLLAAVGVLVYMNSQNTLQSFVVSGKAVVWRSGDPEYLDSVNLHLTGNRLNSPLSADFTISDTGSLLDEFENGRVDFSYGPESEDKKSFAGMLIYYKRTQSGTDSANIGGMLTDKKFKKFSIILSGDPENHGFPWDGIENSVVITYGCDTREEALEFTKTMWEKCRLRPADFS